MRRRVRAWALLALTLLLASACASGGPRSGAAEIGPQFSQFHFNRGRAQASQGQYDRAIADLTRAIEMDPRYVEAWVERGYAHNQTGQYDRAIADLTRALDLSPRYWRALGNRGYSYFQKGEYDQAIAAFTRALEIDPGRAAAYNNRGTTYTDTGQYDQAIADFGLLRALAQSGFSELPVTAAHAARVTGLPAIHRDPFDRMLVAQSLAEPMTLLTNDAVLVRYGPLVQLV